MRHQPPPIEYARDVRLRYRRDLAPWFPLDDRVRVALVPALNRWLIPRSDAYIFTAWQTVYDFRGRVPANSFHMVYDYEYWRTRPPEVRVRMKEALTRNGVRRLSGSRAIDTMLEEAGSASFARLTCGLDTSHWRQIVAQADRPPMVGFPLRDEAHKGMADAFEAVEKIHHALPEVRFAAFGGARIPPPPYVENRGQITNDELRGFYNDCAVFLLPSHFEGWGLPAAEAMACGAALVTTANGGAEEFAIDGETARVVPPRDPDAMADAVIALIGASEERHRLADAGRLAASRMSWDASTDALLDVLAQ